MAPASGTWRLAADGEPAVGAHIVTQRLGYTHHGIYAGYGWVVHYAGWSRSLLRRGPVQQVTLAEFAGGRELWIEQSCNAMFSGEQVVRRARSRLGEDHYRLATNNCEHFCVWCVCGESRSGQIDRWIAGPRRMLEAALAALRPLSGISVTR
jgi:hypothetical protein